MSHDISFNDGQVIDTYEISKPGAKIVFLQHSTVEEVTLKKQPPNEKALTGDGLVVKPSEILGLVYDLDGNFVLEISGQVTEEEKEQIWDLIANADTVLPDSEEKPEFLAQLKDLGWTKADHYFVLRER